MSSVYEICPLFENDKYLLRFSCLDDAKELVNVYGDKKALPFFNSDNCHGDNFYYPNELKMGQAIDFWVKSYQSRWFVRWTIINKEINRAIGTIELFHREGNDELNHVGLLRLDLGSEFEKTDIIIDIMNMIIPSAYELFDCDEIVTKVPIYAVERMEAARKCGFNITDRLLVGTMDGYAYKDYWTIKR